MFHWQVLLGQEWDIGCLIRLDRLAQQACLHFQDLLVTERPARQRVDSLRLQARGVLHQELA